MRTVSRLAALVLVSAFAVPAVAEDEVWYAQTLQRGSQGIQMTHFWSKGDRMRAEAVIRGHRIVSIVNGATYHAYDALGNRGISVARSPRAVAEDAKRSRPIGTEGDRLLQAGAEQVRTEEAGGRSCDLYRLTDERGRREVCITSEGGRFPLWTEVYSRQQGETIRTDYLLWFQPEEIPDGFFEPDPRVQLEVLSYEQYTQRAAKGPVGPVPVLYSNMLHGSRVED